MLARSQLSDRERQCRSRLTKLVHDQELIAGSLIATKQTCGKKNCRCKRGQKHDAVYIALKLHGKRRMLSVGSECRQCMHDAVSNYKQAKKYIETISEECCKRLLGKSRG